MIKFSDVRSLISIKKQKDKLKNKNNEFFAKTNFSKEKINNFLENSFLFTIENSTNFILHTLETCNFLSGNKKKKFLSENEKENSNNYNLLNPFDPFSINLDLILKNIDKRTTIMIRNIPNRYNQDSLLRIINQNFKGLYDFFYVPMVYYILLI